MGNTEKKENEFKLVHPIEHGDDTYETFSIRRPKGKDLKGLFNLKENHDDQLKFVARVCGVPLSVIDEVDIIDDLGRLVDQVMNFLPDSQPISKKPTRS